MDAVTYTPIGVIRTPWREMAGTSLHSVAATDREGTVEIAPPYIAGLRDLADFSHLILLYHLHRMTGYALEVTPFLDDTSHGLFATRAPKRPNPIGFSVVRLAAVAGGILTVRDVDMLDDTPLLDIKPYVPVFDRHDAERTGWYAANAGKVHTTHADDRFR